MKLRRYLSILLMGATLFSGANACDSSFDNREWFWLAGIDISPITSNRRLTVMTRNLYLGADLFRLLDTSSPLADRVDSLWATVTETNFRARASVLADEINTYRPHVIGLQEVTLYRTQTPGDGKNTPAVAEDTNFLTILDAAVKSKSMFTVDGLSYNIVAVTSGADGEFENSNNIDIRLTDRDVLLVRSDLSVANARTGAYGVNFTTSIDGAPITFTRGWLAADVTINGETVVVVNTHLEIELLFGVQVPQAREFLSIFKNETRPMVVTGDFNASADAGASQTYGMMLSGGYYDVWRERPDYMAFDGPTCCESEKLDNSTSKLNQRIDHIYTRNLGPFKVDAASITGSTGSGIIPGTANVYWPSDHAGVVTTLNY